MKMKKILVIITLFLSLNAAPEKTKIKHLGSKQAVKTTQNEPLTTSALPEADPGRVAGGFYPANGMPCPGGAGPLPNNPNACINDCNCSGDGGFFCDLTQPTAGYPGTCTR
jgi:hypothetical protein